MSANRLPIVHNTAQRRFEVNFRGELSVAEYQMKGNQMLMTHTEVPVSQRGSGVAAQLISAALEYAREQGYQVVPLCSYVMIYLKRHPELHALTLPRE